MQQRLKVLLNKVVRSNRRMCPVCGNSFYFFLSLPKHYELSWKKFGFPFLATDFETLNAREFSCPRCGATDRDRLFALYLKRKFKSVQVPSILDIAPSRNLSQWIRNNLSKQYTTADLFMPDVDVKLDIENMHQLSPQSFDMVICSHVLEHVPDDQKALHEILRILKPGGQAILMAPIVLKLDTVIEDPAENDTANRWKRFGQDDHIRLYSRDGWKQRIETAGFSLETLSATDVEPRAEIFGIDPRSVLYIAHRKP